MVQNFLSVFPFHHATISSAFVYLLVTLKRGYQWRRQTCKILGGARCMLLFIHNCRTCCRPEEMAQVRLILLLILGLELSLQVTGQSQGAH